MNEWNFPLPKTITVLIYEFLEYKLTAWHHTIKLHDGHTRNVQCVLKFGI